MGCSFEICYNHVHPSGISPKCVLKQSANIADENTQKTYLIWEEEDWQRLIENSLSLTKIRLRGMGSLGQVVSKGCYSTLRGTLMYFYCVMLLGAAMDHSGVTLPVPFGVMRCASEDGYRGLEHHHSFHRSSFLVESVQSPTRDLGH